MSIFEAAEYAESLSHCNKRPCGFALEVNHEVVSIGFNHGDDEECNCRPKGQQNPDCLHAEVHAIKNYEVLSSDYVRGASTYICCLDCCKALFRKGIDVLFYRDHRNEPEKQLGINFLKENGVDVRHEWSV